jgi:FixJ family two-component response regulator
MSGRALADAAQSLRQGLRVLFTSGYTDDAIVHHGVLDAGVHLLEKPYSRKTLLGAVRNALDGN